MQKKQALERWQSLQPNMPINPTVIPYKHEGKTFSEDGIRITGSMEFIDSVLSRLKDMLKHENTQTRLGLSIAETKDVKTGIPTGSYNCYIKVHERGGEAQMVNEFASAIAKRPVIVSRGY